MDPTKCQGKPQMPCYWTPRARHSQMSSTNSVNRCPGRAGLHSTFMCQFVQTLIFKQLGDSVNHSILCMHPQFLSDFTHLGKKLASSRYAYAKCAVDHWSRKLWSASRPAGTTKSIYRAELEPS